MHIGQSYTLPEFLRWTRRNIKWHFLMAAVPTVLYQVCGVRWLTIPWTIIALLGSATAFIVGFKNVQTYSRTWEARESWGAAISASLSWALMCRDFISRPARARTMIFRHLAWLTALRYHLRTEKSWENINKPYNREYQRFYVVPERITPLSNELAKYISKEEIERILGKMNKPVQLLGIQSIDLQELYDDGVIDNFQLVAMHSLLQEMSGHQGRCEKIKNFPYPRQYATVNRLFLKLFCILLPFALVGEFSSLNDHVSGMLKGYMVWFVIPFSVLISWIFSSLEQVGESTENPFEGGANDIAISQMSRAVEIDIRELLGDTDLPALFPVRNSIIL